MLCDVLIRFSVVVSRRKQATFSISQLYAFLSSLETNTVTTTKVSIMVNHARASYKFFLNILRFLETLKRMNS